MTHRLRIGISTCPNDTFAFHAILNQKIDIRGLDLQFQLLDISELNAGLARGDFEVAKASFPAAILMADRFGVLPSGSAIGFGNGPLLLSAQENAIPASLTQTTLCPGPNTTATLLFKLFYGQTKIEQTLFSEIMPMLSDGKADFGVCIHEGRFTFESSGLYLVEDLGRRWESETRTPLPLGGILADLTLPRATLDRLQEVVENSIRYALAKRSETIATMKYYAQEFSDDVLMQHVDLYVNQQTIRMDSDGQKSISRLQDLAIKKGLIESTSTRLQVLGVGRKSQLDNRSF